MIQDPKMRRFLEEICASAIRAAGKATFSLPTSTAADYERWKAGVVLLSPDFDDRVCSSVSTLLLSVIGLHVSDLKQESASATSSASASAALFEPIFSLIDVTEYESGPKFRNDAVKNTMTR